MRAKSKLLALGLAAALQPAFAEVVTLNFENPANWLESALGSEFGGFSFSGAAFAVGSTRNGCTQKTVPDPDGPPNPDFLLNLNWTGQSCGALYLTSDPWTQDTRPSPKSFTITFSQGFDELKFDFSMLETAGAKIQVFDGRDGTGTELGNADQLLSPTPCLTSGLLFCEWKFDQSIKTVGGATAYSVKVSGLDQQLMLDNLSFNTPSTGTQLPEPGSVGLALSAIGALAWVRRRTATAR